MKRIIFSLIFIMIALAGVTCASASDFNDTAVEIDPDINVVDDIDEVEVNDTQTDSINDTDKAVENNTIDPVEYYSAQYKDLKEKYSQIWYSVPVYSALHELCTMLSHKYCFLQTIDIITEVFCLVELNNPSNFIKSVAHDFLDNLVWDWYPHGGNSQKHNNNHHTDPNDRRKPLG